MQAMADKLYCLCGVLYLMSKYILMMVCCRHAVQHRLSAAASNQSSGGTILHEYPDFILPFVVQALAHHPDFPTSEVCITAHVQATVFAIDSSYVSNDDGCGAAAAVVAHTAAWFFLSMNVSRSVITSG